MKTYTCQQCEAIVEYSGKGRRGKYCLACAQKTGANFSRSLALDKQPWPGRTVTQLELAWAAGFIEGEGCLGRNAIVVTQVNPWALNKLMVMFGGNLIHEQRMPPRKNLYRWKCYGLHAEEVLRLVGPWLSPEKLAQSRETAAQSRDRLASGLRRQGKPRAAK
jgi:hypothetical protein